VNSSLGSNEKSSLYENLDSDNDEFENFDDFDENKNTRKKLTRHQIAEINKIVKISEKEKNQFIAIDEFLEVFQTNFPIYSKEQILDVFQKNSFNFENSYLHLKDPKNFGSKINFSLF
jgi:hypothetical protein